MRNDIDDTLEHILFLARHLHGFDTRHIVKVFLLELNVSTHYDGWRYSIEAITLFSEDPQQRITKEIYPLVARRCGLPGRAGQVERGMRTVIDAAWKNRDDEIWKRYFPVASDGKIKRPSNAEFISRIAEALDLWKVCCQTMKQSDEKEMVL